MSSSGSRSSLSVLYLGPDANRKPTIRPHITHVDRMIALIQERSGAFDRFLRKHFTEVKVVTPETYRADMSDAYDVTVFDALPEPVATRESDGFTRQIRLPDKFDRAAIMVGDVGPFTLGRSGLGLKLDHL